MREVIRTDDAPRAIGTYSQGVAAGGLVFTSGQIGIHPATGELERGGFAAEAQRALRNMGAVLQAGGSSLKSVVKCTVFLSDLSHYASLNEVFARHLEPDPPSRSVVQVTALPKGAQVEIEAIGLVETTH